MIRCNPSTKRRATAGAYGLDSALHHLEVGEFCVNDTGKSSDCLPVRVPGQSDLERPMTNLSAKE